MDNSTDLNWRPDLEREYRLFLMWKSLPVKMLAMGPEAAQESGIEDEELLMLMGIKYQKDFATKFNVTPETLSIWNSKPVPIEYRELDWRVWAKKLTKNVVRLLYEGIEEDKDAARIKLWLQATDDSFVERSAVTQDVSKTTLAGVRDILNALNSKLDEPSPSNNGGDSRGQS